MKRWYEMSPKEVMARIYWMRGQLLPKDWEDEWPNIRAQLAAQDKTYIPIHLRNQAF